MARESFLINPMKRKTRKRTMAKMSKRRRIHRPTLYEVGPKSWARGLKSISKRAGIGINPYRTNPFGEEVILVGANPRSRKRSVRKRRRTLHLRANPVRRHRRSRKRRSSLMSNRPRRRARSYRRNPVRRHRRLRRNPAATMGGINVMKPMTLVMPLMVGLAAKMATERLPGMLNMYTPMTKYAVQAAVAVAGGVFLKKPLGSTNAAIWVIMSGVTILTDVLNTYVFNTAASAIATTAGFGAMPVYNAPGQMSYNQGMNGLGDMGDAGAYPGELGAYPYGGTVQY